MKHINKIAYALICLIVFSCSDSNEQEVTLALYLETVTYKTGSVIACAASDENTGDVLTFFYPEEGAADIRLYQTNIADINPNDFSNYQQIFSESEPIFNGYLRKFTQLLSNEKWAIVTFQLEGEVKVSNPIISKHISKPTVWNDAVTINQDAVGMPNFIWEHNAYGDNAIYFQVVTNNANDLLSGTYTYDNHFQYYNTDNVVLNVTTHNPPDLNVGSDYNFTLMDVSEDNWVNWIVLKTFTAQ